MRLAVLGVAASLSVTTTAQVQSPSGADTGRITGHIVTAYADLVADATVTLARAGEPGPGFPTQTTRSDSDGAFSFAQLPPGRYRLQAAKPGYTSRQLGVGDAGSIGAFDVGPVVEITSDAVDVQVAVRRTASIAGRIIRPDGSAAANVRVVLAIGSGTRRQQLFETQATSQSDGRYEIAGLPPGEYLVGAINVAMPTTPFADTEAGEAARRAAIAAAATAHMSWYPGVTDKEPGTAVTLLEGVNAEGIDIWLTPSQRFAVSGRVSWPVGVAIEGISIDFGDPAGTRSGVWMVSDPGGLFTLGAVPPGPLTLLARAESDQGTLFGIISTEVSVDSVEDVQIVVDRPGLISGRIVYEGTVPPSGRATSVVAVQKLLKVSALYPVPQSSIDTDGRFTLSNTIGEYEFALQGLQRGQVMKRIVRNGRPLPMNRISVAPGETIRDLEIVVGQEDATASLRAERFALVFQSGFEFVRAVARRARPVLGAVLVATAAAGMRILDRQQIEVGLPVATLLVERGGAETGLHPLDGSIGQLARVRHVVEVLVAGNGTCAERLFTNGAIEGRPPAWFDAGGDEIAHELMLLFAPMRARVLFLGVMLATSAAEAQQPDRWDVEDGLHLSPQGYQLWTAGLRPYLIQP